MRVNSAIRVKALPNEGRLLIALSVMPGSNSETSDSLVTGRKISLFKSEKQVEESLGIEGNERIKIASRAAHGTVGSEQDGKDEKAYAKAPYAEEINQEEHNDSHVLEGVTELRVLLSEIRYRDERHIENYVLTKPAYAYGVIAEYQSPHYRQ